ncbi:MAG TPA: HAMP domain-containing sensor histidine kinase [Rhodothermales bacterium]|nr:HAMP domain-containing sensor histidine kinase [Rhodothermales bacterium]
MPALLGFIDGFLPPPSVTLPEVDFQRRGRLLVTSSFGFFFVALFFGMQMAMVDEYPLSSVVVMFSGCGLTVANLLLFWRVRSVTLPGLLLCIESLAIHAFQAYNDMGIEDPVLLWTLVIPWLAAFLVGPSFGYIFAGIVAAITGGFYVLERIGHPFPHFADDAERSLFYFLCASTLALFLGFLGWFYEGQTLKNLRAANASLARANTEVKKAHEHTERILENITDGFFTLNPEGHFTDLNPQAERFLQRPRHEILGENAWDLFSDDITEEIQERVQRAIVLQVPTSFEMLYPSMQHWFDVHLYPFDDGLSIYFSDITERKEYEQHLIEAKEEAENLARLKSNLLANMSHEIRTPLTAVIGFSNILAEEASGEHQQFAHLIGQNGQRLMETLNSVLDLAQLEQGQMTCKLTLMNLVSEVQQILPMWQVMAGKRDLTLAMETQEDFMPALLDSKPLNRMLNNLIGNAIKFTHEGGITLSVGGDAEQVWVKVIDTGIGISASFLPHLFEEFSQESTGLARAYEGNGLGLAITRRLVESMKGTIEVESEKEVGTTFTVAFPRPPEKIVAASLKAAPTEQHG